MFLNGQIIAFSISVALIIVIIGFMPIKFQEILKSSIIRVGGFHLDWWHISHLWFYMVLGCACPGNFWKFAAIGSVWELFEEYSGPVIASYDDDLKKLQDAYWFGRWEDVFINSIGYLIGEWSTTGKIDLSI